jgi:hypothetical protein
MLLGVCAPSVCNFFPKAQNYVGIFEISIPNAAHQTDAITISKSIPFLNVIDLLKLNE